MVDQGRAVGEIHGPAGRQAGRQPAGSPPNAWPMLRHSAGRSILPAGWGYRPPPPAQVVAAHAEGGVPRGVTARASMASRRAWRYRVRISMVYLLTDTPSGPPQALPPVSLSMKPGWGWKAYARGTPLNRPRGSFQPISPGSRDVQARLLESLRGSAARVGGG